MRFLRRSLVGLFLLSLTVGVLAMAGSTFYSALQDRWAKESTARPRKERVFAVNVLTAQMGDVTPEMIAFGEVRSQRVLDVRSLAAGVIVTLADGFVEGGTVKAGEALVHIDPQNARDAKFRATSDLAEAAAEVSEAAAALQLAGDEVKAAQGQAELRLRALTRQQDLRSRGVGTDAAVEAAELAEAVARQAVLARRQALLQAEARGSKAATRHERQEVNLAEAVRRVSDTRITAAFDGTLSGVSAVKGGVVSKNERLAQLIDTKALEVSFRVSTSQYARLLDANGALTKAPVDVVLDVFGVDMLAQGRVSRESAAVGEGLTGRLLFAKLTRPRGFRPGDFVTVRIKEPVLSDVIRLPASAVDAAGTVLLLGDGDRVEQASVEVLRKQGDDVLVRSSAIEGHEVIAERSPLLGVGIKVRPIRKDDAAMNEPEMLELTEARRAKLIAFVEASQRMPEEAKARMLAQLAKPRVPARTVERIESRMGG
ncbi:efflux RND transporter periplasmic adaptor subunit [Profundibacter sp.]